MDFSSVRLPDSGRPGSLLDFAEDLWSIQATMNPIFHRIFGGTRSFIQSLPSRKEAGLPMIMVFVIQRQAPAVIYLFREGGTCQRLNFVGEDGTLLSGQEEGMVSWEDAAQEIIERARRILSSVIYACDEIRPILDGPPAPQVQTR